jgi:prophage antirepressor-like protein
MLLISEGGLYDAFYRSNKQQAVAFRKWIQSTVKELRKSQDYKGYEIFNFIDSQIHDEFEGREDEREYFAEQMMKDGGL